MTVAVPTEKRWTSSSTDGFSFCHARMIRRRRSRERGLMPSFDHNSQIDASEHSHQGHTGASVSASRNPLPKVERTPPNPINSTGPGRRPRLHGQVRQREAVRGEAECGGGARGPPDYLDATRPGRAGRLRRGADRCASSEAAARAGSPPGPMRGYPLMAQLHILNLAGGFANFQSTHMD